jgi:hypothetical protein
MGAILLALAHPGAAYSGKEIVECHIQLVLAEPRVTGFE